MGKNNYFHWIFGENILREDTPTYLINLEIGVSIRFTYKEAYFASCEDFFNIIADVQFFYGTRPKGVELDNILIEAWNFLCEFERKEEYLNSAEDDYL